MRATTATTIFSVGILISFFLPWIDLGLYSINGFEIPTSLDKFITANRIFSNDNDIAFLKVSYMLFLIPLFALINIVMDLSKANFRTQLDEFGIGIIATVLLFAFIQSFHEEAFSTLSIGYYLTLLFGLLGVFSFRRKTKTEITSATTNNLLKDDTIALEKTNLLNQLSQLHSLKENDVITESIYEQERQSILSKLQNKQITRLETSNQSEAITPIRTEEEINIDEEYNALFNRKSWLQRNRSLLIGVSIVLLIGFSIWCFLRNTSNVENGVTGTDAEKPAYSSYVVSADNNNKVFFYKTPHLTEKKDEFFNSRVTVFVQQVEFGFGYVEFTNDTGEKFKGWLWLQELECCTECDEKK